MKTLKTNIMIGMPLINQKQEQQQLINHKQEQQHGGKGSLVSTVYSLQCYIFIVQWVMPPHREFFSRS